MRANKRMRELLQVTTPATRLPVNLGRILSRGFFRIGNCWTFVAFSERCNGVVAAQLKDETGYECFLNGMHVDAYKTSSQLSVALGFADRLLAEWAALKSNKSIRIIVSCKQGDAVLRWHLIRTEQEWLVDDLEKYRDEAVQQIDSCETT